MVYIYCKFSTYYNYLQRDDLHVKKKLLLTTQSNITKIFINRIKLFLQKSEY